VRVRSRDVPKLVLTVVAVLMLAAPPAFAQGGGLASRGCLVNETGEGCTGVGAGKNARLSAISPDGRHVYVRAYDTIEIYSRGANGALTFVGCLARPMSSYGVGCTETTDYLEQHGGIAVSPDNDYVYTTAAPGAVLVYRRDATTGALTLHGCHHDATGGGCLVANGTHGALDVTTSPNGANVYVSAQGDSGVTTEGALVVFTRNTDGTLAYDTCFKDGSAGSAVCTGTPGLGRASAAAVSPDGARLYLVALVGRLAVFNRNADTGALVFNKCFSQGAPAGGCTSGASGLELPHGVAVSPDSANVYVASFFAQAIATFNNSGGTVSQAGCISRSGTGGCTAETGLARMYSVVVSPDGNDVYAAGSDIGFGTDNLGTLVAFDRGAGGALTKRGCLAEGGVDGCGAAPGLKGAQGVSADNRNVYVAASSSGAGSDPGGIAAFLAHQAPPTCEDVTADVPFNGSASITLRCTDPNSDPITLGIQSQPDHGTLGTIDATSNAILYTADAGYSGADSFSYDAVDPDGPGPTATVSLTVAGAPPPPPAAATCRVPKLKGKRLKKARRLLKQRNCKLGTVKKPRGVKGKRAIRRLVVKKQSPRAGKVRPRGTRVNVKLGRKKRR
jgi:DNA-binding beta-propeller fold protein YncE